MTHKAVFLDLNGTLVMPVQAEAPDEYQPIAGSIEAVRLLTHAGFLCPVVTVQSRIEKGIFTEDAFRVWFKGLQEVFQAEGASLLGPYVCPHRFKTPCACKKPQPTLYLQAAQDWDIDPLHSYVVGDTLDDIRAGQAVGAKTAFVRTGWALRYLDEHGHEADFIGEDMLAVANWIVQAN